MAKYKSHIICQVKNGAVELVFSGSDEPQRVTVDADGTITNRLAHGQDSVEHHFVLLDGAKFVSFELKDVGSKPGLDDFQIPGQTMVGGKSTFTAPLQSFVLLNLNSKASAFEYGFVVSVEGRRIEFDPAVRNLGAHRPPYQPESCRGAFMLGFALGVLVAAALFSLALWWRA